MTGKIIEYGVCSGRDNSELVRYVNLQLDRGYQPYGFVYTSVQEDGLMFHQAMVRTATAGKPAKSKLMMSKKLTSK